MIIIVVLDLTMVICTYYSPEPAIPMVTAWDTKGMGYNLRITCVHRVLMLCSGSPLQETLISISSLSGPVRSGMVGQKMLCKVLIASTYNYIRNTCLRLVLRLGCSSLFFG